MKDKALDDAVSASNQLTQSWLRNLALAHDNFVGSGFGVWAVLGALLIGADGPTRAELTASFGLDQPQAQAALAAVAGMVRDDPGLHQASGVWARPDVELLGSYVAACDFATVGPVPSDRTLLDEWVTKHSNGLIEHFPVEVQPDTLLLLASVIAADAEWVTPFQDSSGRWHDQDERYQWLKATQSGFAGLSVLEHAGQRVARWVCPTQAGFDVHLLTADQGVAPAQVLEIGVLAAQRDVTAGDVSPGAITPGAITQINPSELPDGPVVTGLSIGSVAGKNDHLKVSLPKFGFACTHSLLDDVDLWGLRSAVAGLPGAFANMSNSPLAIDDGAQQAVVEFSAAGFKAAAATAVRMSRSARRPAGEASSCRRASLALHQPFGFCVVHRSTGLSLFTGWVGSTEAFTVKRPL